MLKGERMKSHCIKTKNMDWEEGSSWKLNLNVKYVYIFSHKQTIHYFSIFMFHLKKLNKSEQITLRDNILISQKKQQRQD